MVLIGKQRQPTAMLGRMFCYVVVVVIIVVLLLRGAVLGKLWWRWGWLVDFVNSLLHLANYCLIITSQIPVEPSTGHPTDILHCIPPQSIHPSVNRPSSAASDVKFRGGNGSGWWFRTDNARLSSLLIAHIDEAVNANATLDQSDLMACGDWWWLCSSSYLLLHLCSLVVRCSLRLMVH